MTRLQSTHHHLNESDERNSPPVANPQPSIALMLATGTPTALITFDVFDTLIWRKTLFPHDIFLSLNGRHPHLTAWWRRVAERIATVACRRILAREPTLNDIYRLLPLNAMHEVALERRMCVANPHCLAAVMWLSGIGFSIAAVSDMYLDSIQIGTLLKSCGYPDMPVYSSATEGCTKANNGSLLEIAWQQLGVRAHEVIHIGDNAHSDIAMAKQLGARTCHVSTPRSTLFELHPDTPRHNTRAEAEFWGELAIRLHSHIADDHTRAIPTRAAMRTLGQQLGNNRELSSDDAWARIRHMTLETSNSERESPDVA